METGLTYSSTVQVNSTNTALALGSGDMEVFATPALVALMENARHECRKARTPGRLYYRGCHDTDLAPQALRSERRSDSYRGTHRNRRPETQPSKLVQPTAKGWWEKVLTSATLWTGNVS